MKEAPSTPTPLPLPLPLPPPPLETTAAHLPTRRRIRRKSAPPPSSSSSSSSSPTSSSSSGSSSSSIPFSWEHQPGIPKTPHPSSPLSLPLPLPPSRHNTGHNKVVTGSGAAPSKPVPDPFVQRRLIKAGGTITGRFALLDLYGCKTAISVVDAAVSLPHAARKVGAYRVVKSKKLPRTDRRRVDTDRKEAGLVSK